MARQRLNNQHAKRKENKAANCQSVFFNRTAFGQTPSLWEELPPRSFHNLSPSADRLPDECNGIGSHSTEEPGIVSSKEVCLFDEDIPTLVMLCVCFCFVYRIVLFFFF